MQWQEYFNGLYQCSPDFDFSLSLLCELSLLVLHSAVRAFSICELQFYPFTKSQNFGLIYYDLCSLICSLLNEKSNCALLNPLGLQ